jgi:hypothetical protein
MKKKFFSRSQLHSMAVSHKPQLSHTTDRLRHALIGHMLFEIIGDNERIALGWWYRFEQFIDDVPPPWDQQVAPLTVFQPDGDQRWSAAIVITCTPFEATSKAHQPDVESVLLGVDISYLVIPATDIDKGYIKTAEFKSRIYRAVIANPPYGSPSPNSPSTSNQEGFLHEPRPIYPPRSRFLRD